MSEHAARPCGPATAGGPILVTEDCVDPLLDRPYTDLDEQRTIVDPATGVTVTCRYVHGGFEDTPARFSLYFPAPQDYRGRFFQHTYPTFTDEDADAGTVAFAVSHGAYAVSTNNAGGVMAAPDGIGGYRLNAAAAKHSRAVAAQVYGTTERPRGYLYGGSGGAYQTLGGVESTEGVWDGGVAMVPGTPNAIPSMQAAQVLALRALRDVLPQIADAVAPGGSGDPYAGLDDEQAGILREITRLGFPRRGWWQHATLTGGSFPVVIGGVRALDPTYVDDFWSAPGYAGTDVASSVGAARIRHETTVVSVDGSPAALDLAEVPAGDVAGADLVVTGGAAAGAVLRIESVTGSTVTLAAGADPSTLAAIATGDTVRVDNSWLLAAQYYFRHVVPEPDQRGWDHLRRDDGTPLHPQRPMRVGPLLARGAGGAVATGAFHGKLVVLASVLDVEAFPWMAAWYHDQAEVLLGPELDRSFRIWFTDNADHDSPRTTAGEAHVVGYRGTMQQALLDLDRWVAEGAEPPPSTMYEVDAETQIALPPTAADRHGVQPVVTLTVDGGDSVEVAVGDEVELVAATEVPPGAGAVVAVEWDPAGTGAYPVRHSPDAAPAVEARHRHTYDSAGTYFAVVRVTAHREGDAEAPYARVQNLARVRVVVR